MAEQDVECPSGLKGRVRGLKGKEYRLLTGNKNLEKAAGTMGQILRACWLETTDPGPYPNGQDMHWDDALLGDRFYTLMRIRQATYPGESYDFETQCANLACRKRIASSVSLEDMETRPLPEESRQQLLAGENRFQTEIEDGRKVWFKLMTGSDIKRQRQIQDLIGPAAQGIPLALATRILEVEGLKSKGARDVFNFLDDLDFHEHRNLLERFDAADCGVQTDVLVECQWCGDTATVALPLGRTFLLPKKDKNLMVTSLNSGEV
jgi:hypothetical protein